MIVEPIPGVSVAGASAIVVADFAANGLSDASPPLPDELQPDVELKAANDATIARRRSRDDVGARLVWDTVGLRSCRFEFPTLGRPGVVRNYHLSLESTDTVLWIESKKPNRTILPGFLSCRR